MSDDGDSGDEDDVPFGDLLDEIDRERSDDDAESPDGAADASATEPSDGVADDAEQEPDEDSVPPNDGDSATTGGDEADDAPFGDLLADIDRKRDAASDASADSIDGSADDLAEQAFSEETYDDVDSDELWDELTDDSASATDEEPAVDAEQEFADEEGTHVVPKRSFCEMCRHVSDPPEFRCTHDGTAIIEFVDTDHVRVSNCPIVEERRAESELE